MGENVSKKSKAIEWDGEFEEAFRKLKEVCISIPIRAYGNFSKLFKLHTNACTLGLGSILYQNQDGIDWVIGYASRAHSKAEHKYPAHKLKLWVLKWIITEQFHKYLYGNTFVIYMENKPLTHKLTSAKLDAIDHCWLASLADWNFILSYWSGKMSLDVDVLLHIPREKHNQHIKADTIHALISHAALDTTIRGLPLQYTGH